VDVIFTTKRAIFTICTERYHLLTETASFLLLKFVHYRWIISVCWCEKQA